MLSYFSYQHDVKLFLKKIKFMFVFKTQSLIKSSFIKMIKPIIVYHMQTIKSMNYNRYILCKYRIQFKINDLFLNANL